MIAPEWLKQEQPNVPRAIEGDYTDEQIAEFNVNGYNIYYWPNYPKIHDKSRPINGSNIDVFTCVFVDFDLKSNAYSSKSDFLLAISSTGIRPSMIVDSGNGIHVYWNILDLDAKSFLRLSRRLMRLFNTDDAVQKIAQLMRLPGTLNTKNKENLISCEIIEENPDVIYSCEELDQLLPPITKEDEQYCNQHYDKTYNIEDRNIIIDDELPPKFGKLLLENHEAKAIWAGGLSDRSAGDYRLGHIMFASGFTKEEAMSVLLNSAKAMTRAPVHRISYADNIVNKIWTYELESSQELNLSNSVEDILKRPKDTLKGTPFRCHKRIDNTQHGFRLGQVIGLVGGSGIGKTAFGLNMFRWFIEENPDYHHFFIPLEQPANEIADRWNTMCEGSSTLNGKVHVMSNYDDDGNFRHLSLSEIQEYIEKWQKTTGNKVGCIVIDHIGALKKKGTSDENQDLMAICHSMKAFAVQTNTLLVMQSQTSREKAGIGDLELDKDAAYGTSTFEWYCDYLITIWQPLKRCHSEQACPTVTAFKFCKIRHKRAKLDVIKEDVPYYLYFDSEKEQLRDMTQSEETSFKFFLSKATNKRKADRKTELLEYTSVKWGTNEKEENQKTTH